MHYIETQLAEFIKSNNIKQELLQELSSEFATRIQDSVLERFKRDKDETSFNIRMSNIGLPLRQLCLQRDHGRKINSSFAISGFYGTMLEHFMLFLLKASKVNVQETNKKIKLDVNGFKIPGELDLIIDGAVWDVKSASDYSYDVKFESYKTLETSDSFGYLGQLFGYAMAEDIPVGGWIVINKAKGLIKVVPVPLSIQKEYRQKYLSEFDFKINHINKNLPAPACDGVVKEYFYKKETGNLILNRECTYCSYKEHCHPTVKCVDSLVSTAQDKPQKYYVKIHEKFIKNA